MKWFFLTAAVALTVVFGLPFREFDTGKLLPIRTVQVAFDGGTVQLVSEVGEGSGATWAAAVKNLRENASGDVFFDTAEQIIFCGDLANAYAVAASTVMHEFSFNPVGARIARPTAERIHQRFLENNFPLRTADGRPYSAEQSVIWEILRSGDLRPAAKIYCADELQDPEGLSDYLSAHESSLTLADLRARQ